MEAINKALDIYPKYFDYALSERGATYQYLGQFDKAMEDFNSAINIDPTRPWYFVLRSGLYRKLGDYKCALDDLNTAIDLNPEYYFAIATHCAVNKKLGKPEEAVNGIDKVLSIEPRSISDYYDLAVAYLVVDKIEDSIKMLKKAFEDDDNKVYAKADDLFDPIKETPEFKALFD